MVLSANSKTLIVCRDRITAMANKKNLCHIPGSNFEMVSDTFHARNRIEGFIPRIVLIDITMDNEDEDILFGYSMHCVYGASIIYTGSNMHSIELQGYIKECKAKYLKKPFSGIELLSAFNSCRFTA